jgi:predicted extracellular nuclease
LSNSCFNKFKMLLRDSKTLQFAAFFCALNLASCSSEKSGPESADMTCSVATTPIANVQGEASESPMTGQQVSVQGIVTLIQSDRGIYIEEPDSDANKRTSNAIFIQTSDLPHWLTQGTLVSTEGTVSEIGKGRYPVTALTNVSGLIQCSGDHSLPLTNVSLPLSGPGREAVESMRIQVNGVLTVSDVYRFGQGQFTLSGNGFQFVSTEILVPGPKAEEHTAKNRSFSLPALMPDDSSGLDLLMGGTSVTNINGVLGHDGRDLRLSLQLLPTVSDTTISPPSKPAAGTLRTVSMNLHNYFNGDGNGHGFPTPRGAKTFKDFQNQGKRISAAIKELDPHVIAVMELENDGFDNDSAAHDFIQLANTATNAKWAITRPVDDNTGSDAITVGFFYRTDKIKTLGAAQTLTGPEFKRSRQPQAQVFQPIEGGEKTLIVINHLKSKGSCPKSGAESNQKDGQGCWNPMRTVSAQKMAAWSKQLANSADIENILILGDMNAYRFEDPINAIRAAGFTEMMDEQAEPTYSFVYFGQAGTLDYAFASDALHQKIDRAFIWHANAALPADMELPQPWLRFSDHDPVVVDIRSRQSSTSD